MSYCKIENIPQLAQFLNETKSFTKKKPQSYNDCSFQRYYRFNTFIRVRDAKLLNGKCFTCGERGSQAGHFIHSANAVRFEETAVHLQCSGCNLWKSGNLVEYTVRMIKDYGQKWVDELRRRGRIPQSFTTKQFRKIEETYKNKLKDLNC